MSAIGFRWRMLPRGDDFCMMRTGWHSYAHSGFNPPGQYYRWNGSGARRAAIATPGKYLRIRPARRWPASGGSKRRVG